ncbi:MAG: YjgP/YjgQ family permease [Lentisphaerae bacterium]|nr:YjgP/YjgQ family permease [Lentisphaerota bacterium]
MPSAHHAPAQATTRDVSSRRRLSTILSAYFCREFILPLFCALLAFAVLFLINDVFDDLPDFLNQDIPSSVVMRYFLAKQPANLINVIPISVLLAASFMVMMMGKNSELTAMRAAGLSLGSCAWPVWLVASIMCLTVFAIGESWGPAGAKAAHDIRRQWVDKDDDRLTHIAFANAQQRRDWFIEELQQNDTAQNVIVRQYRPDGSTDWVLNALNAEYHADTWTFVAGDIKRYDERGALVVGEPEFFHQHQESFAEAPSDIRGHSKAWDLLTIRELRAVLNGNILPASQIQRLLKVMFWHHLCFPLASLVGALFGIALTIAQERSGVMKGFATAVGMLVLFYLVGQFTMVMGKNGWLPAFAAGALPSLAFTAAGIFTMWRKQ